MGEYLFRVRNKRMDAATAARFRKIAREYGGTFVNVLLPEGPRSWFALPDGHNARRYAAEILRRIGEG